MDINALIDSLEDIIASATHIPMSNKIVITEQKIYEIIDEMRARMPEELKQARWIVKEKEEMLVEAEKESQRIIKEAQDRASDIASEKEVVKLAEQKANQVIEEARAKEKEIRLGAEDYADEALANLEVTLGKLLTTVQRSRDRLQGRTETR